MPGFSVKLALDSVAIVLTSVRLVLKLNALAVVVKLLSGVTCIVVSLVEPKFILPAANSAGTTGNTGGVYVNTPVPLLYAKAPVPLALACVTLTSPLTSLSAGPVYVITPVPESYAALPKPPASVTLIWALDSAALGRV